MPETAAFIDACRDAFGAEMIDAAIRSAMQGMPTFHAVENGLEFGTPMPAPVLAIKVADMPDQASCTGCTWLTVKAVSPDGKREVRNCRKYKTMAMRKCADWSAK